MRNLKCKIQGDVLNYFSPNSARILAIFITAILVLDLQHMNNFVVVVVFFLILENQRHLNRKFTSEDSN